MMFCKLAIAVLVCFSNFEQEFIMYTDMNDTTNNQHPTAQKLQKTSSGRTVSLSSVGRQCCCLADGAQVLYHQPLLHALCVVPVTAVKGANAVFDLVLLLRDASSKSSLELWTGKWDACIIEYYPVTYAPNTAASPSPPSPRLLGRTFTTRFPKDSLALVFAMLGSGDRSPAPSEPTTTSTAPSSTLTGSWFALNAKASLFNGSALVYLSTHFLMPLQACAPL
ncbi:hypothetical protein U9M48_018144 [Paspalum notatum var. saurae]|uniref:Uncharacterized protein n=1 Tax=Paspalum notatum var. saurae TaxID=547442 RepID=A0AAQ3T8W9_PASNO